jgi:hypothetical protein
VEEAFAATCETVTLASSVSLHLARALILGPKLVGIA